MKVFIREAAEEDLDRIYAWIAQDNPVVAARVVTEIRDRISFLEIDSLAKMGRPGRDPGTRELIEYLFTKCTRIAARSRCCQSRMELRIGRAKKRIAKQALASCSLQGRRQ
jgi:plasmid stabilization system protein ParE